MRPMSKAPCDDELKVRVPRRMKTDLETLAVLDDVPAAQLVRRVVKDLIHRNRAKLRRASAPAVVG